MKIYGDYKSVQSNSAMIHDFTQGKEVVSTTTKCWNAPNLKNKSKSKQNILLLETVTRCRAG